MPSVASATRSPLQRQAELAEEVDEDVTIELLPDSRPLLASLLRALPAGLVLVAVTRIGPRGVWWWRAAVLGTLNTGASFPLLFVALLVLRAGAALDAARPAATLAGAS